MRGQEHGRGDAGMALVELLVAGIVTSILLSAVGVLFTGALSASRSASARVGVTAEARFASNTVGRRLRVAARPAPGVSVFTSATSSSVGFYANLPVEGSVDPAPTLVTYAVDASRGCLLETVTPPTGTPRLACLARGDVTPLFRYYQVAKRPTIDFPTPSPVPTAAMTVPSGGLSPTDLALVGAVELQLTVGNAADQGAGRPVVLTSRSLLVNLLNEETP